jgi:ribose 5-phosphate isomerase B
VEPFLLLTAKEKVMKIHIGSDHAGFDLKSSLIAWLVEKGYEVQDHGTYSADRADYPDYAHAVSQAVLADHNKGVLICGSANGVCMAANKHAGIRAALCWNKEVAELARAHNDANIIGLPARFISNSEAEQMLEAFLHTSFEGGRHQQRVEKINCI